MLLASCNNTPRREKLLPQLSAYDSPCQPMSWERPPSAAALEVLELPRSAPAGCSPGTPPSAVQQPAEPLARYARHHPSSTPTPAPDRRPVTGRAPATGQGPLPARIAPAQRFARQQPIRAVSWSAAGYLDTLGLRLLRLRLRLRLLLLLHHDVLLPHRRLLLRLRCPSLPSAESTGNAQEGGRLETLTCAICSAC